MVKNRVALQAERIQTFSNLPQTRACAFAEAVVDPPRVVSRQCHAAKGVGGLAAEMQRSEAPSEALPDGAPLNVIGQVRVVGRA